MFIQIMFLFGGCNENVAISISFDYLIPAISMPSDYLLPWDYTLLKPSQTIPFIICDKEALWKINHLN